jgi:hypothetical protein
MPEALRLRPPRVSESALQAQIVEALQRLGYRVMEVGKGRKACHQCGTVPRGWIGNTSACGDLLINRAEWGNCWVMVELKAQGGMPTKGRVVTRGRRFDYVEGQQDLIDAGVMALARSLDEVLAVVAASRTHSR